MNMRSKSFRLLALAVLCLAFGASDAVLAQVPGKKLIELGWDIPCTQYIRQNYVEMEKNAPFDGILYTICPTYSAGESGVRDDSSDWMWSDKKWNRADYQTCIDDLRSCRFTKFHHNFIRMNFSPATVAWDDDAAWETLLEKVSICAWVAKESGSEGIAPDFESYSKAMFNFKGGEGRSFAEAQALARKRGAQFIQAIQKEFPDATLLCLWMNSLHRDAGRSENPDLHLQSKVYALLPAFINGMLSAAGEKITLVDGCENGYYLDGQDAFQKYALDMISLNGPCINLVEPGLRAKYRAQVQCGFGVYLDMYVNPPESIYYRAAREGETRLDRFCDNLAAAWGAADEYVWVYGEKHRWWNIPEGQEKIRHWEDALPGISDRLRWLAHPDEHLAHLEKVAHEGGLGENLLQNSAFLEGENGKPSDWGFWQREDSNGKFKSVHFGENSAGGFEKVLNGCYIQGISVKPGEKYLILGKVRLLGNASALISAQWQTEDQKWTHWGANVAFVPPAGDEAEWKTIRGIVTVPKETGRLMILTCVYHQHTLEDECAFDDVEVYRLSP
ncbi:MAG: hypothetical protein Q4D38_10620 [Planctomycetia bacterium]|nr:hypothetical protein [Planctomycetia bacterium]